MRAFMESSKITINMKHPPEEFELKKQESVQYCPKKDMSD